jgi:hypothetical protein
MTYSVEKDFLYTQNNLFAILETIGLDLELIDSYTLKQVLEQCTEVYGSSQYDKSSASECERHASLRRAQMNVRRFWYYYQFLKWRIENV